MPVITENLLHKVVQNISRQLIETLAAEPVQQFIRDHEFADERTIVLRAREISGISAPVIADQIAGRRKAKEKLPIYYNKAGIVYPPGVNLEQSSSAETGAYKQRILAALFPGRKTTCADLTGGFGVDAFFFSLVSDYVDYVEPQQHLLDIARHNHEVLGANNIRYHHTNAEDFLQTSNSYDFIYIDPSRRTAAGKKTFSLKDSEPDIIGLKEKVFDAASTLLLKTSPLLDVQAGIRELHHVKRVYILSVYNECKEVLFVCNKEFSGEPVIEAVNLTLDKIQTFQFTYAEEGTKVVAYTDPLQYLYEPNASILKGGAFKSVADTYKVQKLHPNTHLYTSGSLVQEFPGRKFVVESLIKGRADEIKNHFPEGKANVTTRNYPLTPVALKKKVGLTDGGDKYLIGFSGQRKKFLAVARRV
jgi:hypothetical protein